MIRANDLPMDVSVLLEPTIDLPRLTEILDGLGHEGRGNPLIACASFPRRPPPRRVVALSEGDPVEAR